MAVTLVLEPHGDLVDDLTSRMGADENTTFRIDGSITAGTLASLIETHYGWALSIGFDSPAETARFWYVSEEKLEPRLGERHAEPGSELEEPLGIGRNVCRLYQALRQTGPDDILATFLLAHPEHRHAARRVLVAASYPYAEIRENLVGADMLAIDLLRCKLSFFGATKFDPRSDRWVRITMYQDAPFPDEIDRIEADEWTYPDLPAETG